MPLTRTLFFAPFILAVASASAAEPQKFQWNIPGAKESVTVPGKMEVDGIPMRVQAVRSTLRTEDLLQHFASKFEEAGLFIAPKQPQLLREPQLTALDPATFVTYTVILQPNPDGSTMVFLAEANVAARKKAPSADFAPVPKDVSDVLRSNLAEAQTLAFTTPMDRTALIAFYAEALGKAGFRRVEAENKARADGPVVFRRGAEEISVSIRPAERAGSRVLVMKRAVLAE